MGDTQALFKYMKRIRTALLTAITLSLALFSCRYPELKQQAPEVNHVKLGQKFRITLPEDHRKGETWQLKKDEHYRAFEDLGSVWHGVDKGVDFNLKSLLSGQYTLTLHKSYHQDSLEIKQYIVNTEP
jgi:hypothetical protein